MSRRIEENMISWERVVSCVEEHQYQFIQHRNLTQGYSFLVCLGKIGPEDMSKLEDAGNIIAITERLSENKSIDKMED